MKNDNIKKMIADYIEVTIIIDKHCGVIEKCMCELDEMMCAYDGSDLMELSMNTAHHTINEQYDILGPYIARQNEISQHSDMIGYLLRMIHDAIIEEDFQNVVILESELAKFVF